MITWDMLDQCRTPDAIAALLRQHGIRGRRQDSLECPLAIATGWEIARSTAYLETWDTLVEHPLTAAERRFVARLDRGYYPDLVAA